jgi:hypothetical protein
VPSDDLISLPGLEEKHLRVLARQHITDFRGLADADSRIIYQAMRNLRPRPTLEQVSRWQDEARSKLAGAMPGAPDWQTVASFVVVFSQRLMGDTWERRAEAEQAEVEPERNPQVWSGWDCAPICGWMLSQLHHADRGETSGPPADQAEPMADQAQPTAVPAEAPPGRPRLRIEGAVIIDATDTVDVVLDNAPVTDVAAELVAPVRVILTLGGAPSSTRLQAVARIRRPDGAGWNPQDPVVVSESGQAELDLSALPAGEHEMSLIAWAPDAAAQPVSVRLPRLTIRI